MLFSAVVLLSLPSTVAALGCYTTLGYVSLNTPTNATLTVCLPNVFTCIKQVDFMGNNFLKNCGPVGSNCTTPTQPINAPANCQNTSAAFNSNTQMCCCYGDSCNSAPPATPLLLLAGLSVAVATALNDFAI